MSIVSPLGFKPSVFVFVIMNGSKKSVWITDAFLNLNPLSDDGSKSN